LANDKIGLKFKLIQLDNHVITISSIIADLSEVDEIDRGGDGR
jgi:hypothetical protein